MCNITANPLSSTGHHSQASTSTGNQSLNSPSFSFAQTTASLLNNPHHHHHHHQHQLNAQQLQQHSLNGSGLNLSSTSSTNSIGVSSTTTSNGLGLNLSATSALHSLQNDALSGGSSTVGSASNHILTPTTSLGLSASEPTHRSNLTHSDLSMSHWLNEQPTASVKTETRSPALDTNLGNSLIGAGLSNASHLDSSSLFCANSSSGLDTLQSASNSFEHKQDYYNYYNSMQQYTPSFYSSYAPPYPTRTPKISSPNTYLPSSYASAAAAAAATNNNASQLYSSYGYNNFSQFGGSVQQDYSSYYNDQYGSYYNPPSYSPYVSSPGSSGSQSFHVPPGLPDSPSDAHPTTPTMLTHSHSPNSPLSISPNTPTISTKSTPTTKSGRARGRRHAHPSPTRSVISDAGLSTDNIKISERVFVWDLDETIIIFHSLLTGTYANRHSKDAIQLQFMATGIEELVFNLADNHFFFNDIEHCDQVHIDDVSSDDNGQELTNYNFSTDGFHANTAPGTNNSISIRCSLYSLISPNFKSNLISHFVFRSSWQSLLTNWCTGRR